MLLVVLEEGGANREGAERRGIEDRVKILPQGKVEEGIQVEVATCYRQQQREKSSQEFSLNSV